MNMVKELVMPDIQPDWSFPALTGIQRVASYSLATALMLALIALIFCAVTLGFKGFGSTGMHQMASKSVGYVAVAILVLGAINGIFGFLVGFDLGF